MAKTTAEINRELIFYQCCLADLAIKYILKEIYGHQNIECLLNKLIYGTTLLEALKCPSRVLTLEHMTQTEIEDNLEKLGDLCGCITCQDPDDLTEDDIEAGLQNYLLQSSNGNFILIDP